MIKDMFFDVRERQKKIKDLSRLHDDIIFCLNQIGLVGALKVSYSSSFCIFVVNLLIWIWRYFD